VTRATMGGGAPPNRRERRRNATRYRLGDKNATSATLLSLLLAGQARKGAFSRREAKRRLLAEVTRRYGKHHAELMDVHLYQFPKT